MECKDQEWPKPDKIGKQELVVRVGSKEVSLQTSKIGSYAEVQKTKDPTGLTVFFYLVQDLKCFVFSLVNLHFRVLLSTCRSSPSDRTAIIKNTISLSLPGKHGLGLRFAIIAGCAVWSVELIFANDELQALVASEQLA